MTTNIAKRRQTSSRRGLRRSGCVGDRFPDVNPIGMDREVEPDNEALRVTPEPAAVSTQPINPARPPLPPKELPGEIRDVIVTAYRQREALASVSITRAERFRPMWDLTTTLCGAVPELAGELGEVALRLCELPANATADRVWDRVRTAARADMWEYSREHHRCVRIGDWRP